MPGVTAYIIKTQYLDESMFTLIGSRKKRGKYIPNENDKDEGCKNHIEYPDIFNKNGSLTKGYVKFNNRKYVREFIRNAGERYYYVIKRQPESDLEKKYLDFYLRNDKDRIYEDESLLPPGLKEIIY